MFEQVACTCMRLVACVPDFYLTFNVSLQQLADEQFTAFMRTTLEKYRVSGRSLVAEMTESCMDEQPENLLRFVDDCREMGIEIALDDFGSGYSSLNMLKDITVDILKIDMGFLARQDQSQRSESILEAIVSMARFMDLRIMPRAPRRRSRWTSCKA